MGVSQITTQPQTVTWNGLQVQTVGINTYNSAEFDFAIGSATAYFYHGTPVGLADTYNLDAQVNERSCGAEVATRLTSDFRPSRALDYKIKYP